MKQQFIPNPTRPGAVHAVDLVTDRALRYRAQKNPPPGPRICHYCGSDRHVEIEHVDGREENTAPENLTFACRSCNTRKGAHFARHGIGRKTRQYNPSGRRGASGLAEWLNAVCSVQGAGGDLETDRAIGLIQATPHARRTGYARELAAAKVEFAKKRNPEEFGPHGPILRQFHHDDAGAIAKLMELGTGDAIGALWHPEVGDIDLVWGEEGTSRSDGYGVAKLVRWHPEVLGGLQAIVERLPVIRRSENRIHLEDERHLVKVRLEWDGKQKTWLLTAFEKPSAGRRTNVSGAHATGRQSPPPGGSATSIGRKARRGNPPASEPEYEQYLWAVTHHERGAHDEGGKVIHATSPATRSAYASKIAQSRRKHGTHRITGKRSEVPF